MYLSRPISKNHLDNHRAALIIVDHGGQVFS